MASSKRPTRKSTAPKAKSTPAEAPILDLRELVRLKAVQTSVGEFKMRKITSLSPMERAEVMAIQEQAEAIAEGADPKDMKDAAAMMAASADVEDKILQVALVGTNRAERDAIPAPERGAIIATFFGATDEVARDLVTQAMEATGWTGEKSSPASSGSTGARRKSS